MPRKPLRTVAELLAELPPEQRPELFDCTPTAAIGQPSDDSRSVVPGGCFIATLGLTVDGHRFVDAALRAGAGLLIVQRDRAPELEGHPRIVVEDTRAALPILAAGWYGWPGERLRLAGITGTNGKTTTAHLVGAVLRAADHPHLRLGTTGNWLVDHESRSGFTTAFPLELQALLADALARGATHGVMEVSSHALEQGRAAPLHFASVALTSFSQDHLDYHPSMAAYLEAKCLLAREHCDPGGVALAPLEQGAAAEAFLAAAAQAGVRRAWRTSRADPSAADIAVIERRPGSGLRARVRTPIGELELRSPMVGEFNLDNLLVTIGVCIGLGLELEQIAAALAKARGAPGRLEPVVVPGVPGPAVYVDYAHTPDAVERALEALRPSVPAGGELIVLLGCGGDRDPSKRPLMGAVASRGADRFYATSDNPRTEGPEAIVDQMIAGAVPQGALLIREVDRGAAIARAIAEAGPADIVLIAGKGHEDYQILGTQKIHFDDREHAEQALRRRG
ncbi:MAG: UDP-N-acetylmuramoyl-L-alanyl-D-glutamate--2,6-diaminopimelate ligase [Enhygromyxa sp.]